MNPHKILSHFVFLLFSETNFYTELINLISKKSFTKEALSKISISHSQEDIGDFGSTFFCSLFQPPTRLGYRWDQDGKH